MKLNFLWMILAALLWTVPACSGDEAGDGDADNGAEESSEGGEADADGEEHADEGEADGDAEGDHAEGDGDGDEG